MNKAEQYAQYMKDQPDTELNIYGKAICWLRTDGTPLMPNVDQLKTKEHLLLLRDWITKWFEDESDKGN